MAVPVRLTTHVTIAVVTAMSICSAAVLLNGHAETPTARAAPERLYVVASHYATQTGRIFVVDPGAGKIITELRKGYQPDVLPSPDGTKLFVSYDRRLAAGAVFEVLDASTGAVLFRRSEIYARGGRPGGYDSRMVLSRDGTWLFRYKRFLSEKTGLSEWLETFDTVQNVMLPATASLPLCGEPKVVPSDRREELYVLCPTSNDLRIVTLTAEGGTAEKHPPRISTGGVVRPGVGMLALMTDPGQLSVIKSNGAVVRFDTSLRAISAKDMIDRVARRATLPDDRVDAQRLAQPANTSDWLAQRAIAHRAVLSPDGGSLYTIASGKPPSIPAEIVELNARTFERRRAIPLRSGVSSFGVSRDGARLYALDVPNAAIVVIDVASGVESKTISGVGPEPVFLILGP